MRVLLGLVAALVAGSANAALVHHYDFSTPGNVNDLVGGQDGTLVDNTSVSGGVLNLDGSGDKVTFGAKLVPSSGDFTVALFARQLSYQTNYIELISQGFSGGPGFYIGHDPSRQIRGGDAWLSTSVAFPSDGVMHHYALVRSASNTELYIDGALVASRGSAISVTSGGDDTVLGAQFGGYGEYFHGMIDDVRIYDNALSGAQVAALVPEPTSLAVLLVGGWLAVRRPQKA